jgi:hypothetical protein
MGNPPTAVEEDRSFANKLKNMTVTLGQVLREALSLLVNLDACFLHFQTQKTFPCEYRHRMKKNA